jgi:uncharacterized protein YkwD
MRGGFALWLALGGVACTSVESTAILASPTNADASAGTKAKVSASAATDEKPDGEAKATDAPGWVTATRSPWVAPHEEGRDAREVALATLCGTEDAALTRVAREIVASRARGLGTPDPDAIVAKLRVAGAPHVRPRLIVASGRSPLDETKLRPELASRASGVHGPSRCGIAIAPTPHGGEVLVALRVEALADMAPLPTRARTGEWLTLEARLHVGARSAKLIVLGPHGAPRTVPTSLDPVTGVVRARFALDQPGGFTVQLVGDVAEGPRPLLEARVFADVVPTAPGEEPAAPGEEAGGTSDDASALARMVAGLRTTEGSPPLARDEKLDVLARAHADRMRDGHAVAHDMGEGDFRARFEAEGSLDARAVGENVAHAPTVALAHRALHASPSHRINLLRADYTHLGVAIARAADGSVYVCETFAAARPARPDR